MIRLRLLLVLAAFATPCTAGIYGYMDELGVAHVSDVPLDGYVIFKKDPPVGVVAPGGAVRPPHIASPRNDVRVSALRKRYSQLVARVAREQRLEPALLHAVVTIESGYNERALSARGARGLMQLMPDTAQRYGVGDAWNPLENLRGGARYLRDLLALFDNDLVLVLAAYNAGEGAVIDSGKRIPPYPETRTYVPRVLQQYERYRAAARL
jgi:soluble lytic murein transglycosylase-like protein